MYILFKFKKECIPLVDNLPTKFLLTRQKSCKRVVAIETWVLNSNGAWEIPNESFKELTPVLLEIHLHDKSQ